MAMWIPLPPWGMDGDHRRPGNLILSYAERGRAAGPLVALGSLLMASGLLIILRRNLQRPVAAMITDVGQGAASPNGNDRARLDRHCGQRCASRLRERTDELESEVLERKKAEAAVRAKENISAPAPLHGGGHLRIDKTEAAVSAIPRRSASWI